MRQRRLVFVLAALLLGYGLVLARLVELQVLEGPLWLAESERSMVTFRALPSERGWILDRHGEPLARHREVRDLVFRYRDWRRQTVAGQASHAWTTLGTERIAVGYALERAEALTAALGELTVGDVAALEPHQRRRDLGYYLERLLGEGVWAAVVERLRDERGFERTLASLEGYEAGRSASDTRARAEQQALAALARVTERSLDEVLAQMERSVQRSHERVAAGLQGPGLSERDAYRRLQQLHAEFDDDPVTLAEGVSYDAQTLLAIRGSLLGGLEIHTESRRDYPLEVADVEPLLVGLVGGPSEEDMGPTLRHRARLAELASLPDLTAEELDELELLRVQAREVDYVFGEERGRLGLEAALEGVLRGKRGWVATSQGSERLEVRRQEPQRGLNVVLTLDLDLQRACQEVLDAMWEHPPEVAQAEGEEPLDVPEHWSGAIVLLDPRDGQILALASGPRPTRRRLTEEYGELLGDDPQNLLQHRAINPGVRGNLPPPGSTFKPVSALAGLSAGVGLLPQTTLLCEGRLDVGDRAMGCLGRHGEIALVDALARSCNIYFYRLGTRVGAEPLAALAERFGFGGNRSSGLLLGNETLAALGVPVSDGLHETRARLGPPPWGAADAMRLAIGQAPLDDVTPLQVASMIGAVGTGTLRPPALIRAIEGYPDIPPRPAVDLGLRAAHLAAVREGLAAVVDSPSGTAHPLALLLEERSPWLVGQIAAKTGSAQVGGGRTHAWFAGYLPRHDPRLAVAVLVEDCGLHGGEAARPVFEWLLAKPAMEDFLWRQVLGRQPPAELPR